MAYEEGFKFKYAEDWKNDKLYKRESWGGVVSQAEAGWAAISFSGDPDPGLNSRLHCSGSSLPLSLQGCPIKETDFEILKKC